MAHFAQIENGIVTSVIVVSNDDCGGGNFPESEPVGQAFITSLGLDGVWQQTSYSSSFRNVYAGAGFTFDRDLGEYGEFITPLQHEPAPPVA